MALSGIDFSHLTTLIGSGRAPSRPQHEKP